MKGFLLDTNVVSELRRPRPDDGVVRFLRGQAEALLYLSEVSFAELRFGVEQLADMARRADLTSWIDAELRSLFDGRTLPVSEDVIVRWRIFLEQGRRRGHTFGQPDLFIAAIAAEEQLIVVSRDSTHFIAAGVPLLDPWNSQFHAPSGRPSTVADLGRPDLLEHLLTEL